MSNLVSTNFTQKGFDLLQYFDDCIYTLCIDLSVNQTNFLSNNKVLYQQELVVPMATRDPRAKTSTVLCYRGSSRGETVQKNSCSSPTHSTKCLDSTAESSLQRMESKYMGACTTTTLQAKGKTNKEGK